MSSYRAYKERHRSREGRKGGGRLPSRFDAQGKVQGTAQRPDHAARCKPVVLI